MLEEGIWDDEQEDGAIEEGLEHAAELLDQIEEPPSKTALDHAKARTVILDLRIGNKSFQGSVSVEKLQLIDAEEDGDASLDPDFVRATKHLINKSAMAKLRSLDLSMRRDLLELAIPNHLYKSRYYLLLLCDVVPVVRDIKEYVKKRDLLVRNLFSDDHYETLIKEAEGRLGKLFNRNNYPPVEAVRAQFTVSYQFAPVNVDFTFEALDVALVEKHQDELEGIFAEEQVKHQAKWESAVQDIERACAAQLLSLTTKLEEALTPEADGKPKTIREPMVEKLTAFLSTFEQRNVTNSSKLMELAAKAREALSGVHINKLRYSDDVREQVAKVFHAVTTELDTMVVKTSKRTFAAPTEDV